MGVIEDVRQVIQDLVAPQLKSLDARLTSLEHHVDQRFASLEMTINQRLAAVEAVSSARYEAVIAKFAQLDTVVATNHSQLSILIAANHAQLSALIASNHAAILQELDLDKRLRSIEAWQIAHTPAAQLPPTLNLPAENTSATHIG